MPSRPRPSRAADGLGRWLAAATAVGAAAVLVWGRRRLRLAPDGSAPPDPRPLATLAGWRPAAPARPLRRAAAYAWAAPVSAAGLLAALAGGRARLRVADGVVVLSGVRGLTGTALRLRGFTAITLGHVVLCRDEPSPALLAHELVHVRQAERFGVLLAPLYLGLLAVYGYRRHPMERAARLAQRDVAEG